MLPKGFVERRVRVNNIAGRIHEAILPGDQHHEIIYALHAVMGEFLNANVRAIWKEPILHRLNSSDYEKVRNFLLNPTVWSQDGADEIWDILDLGLEEEDQSENLGNDSKNGGENEQLTDGW